MLRLKNVETNSNQGICIVGGSRCAVPPFVSARVLGEQFPRFLYARTVTAIKVMKKRPESCPPQLRCLVSQAQTHAHRSCGKRAHKRRMSSTTGSGLNGNIHTCTWIIQILRIRADPETNNVPRMASSIMKEWCAAGMENEPSCSDNVLGAGALVLISHGD